MGQHCNHSASFVRRDPIHRVFGWRFFQGLWQAERCMEGWPAVERQRAPGFHWVVTAGSLTLDHQPPMHCGSSLSRENGWPPHECGTAAA